MILPKSRNSPTAIDIRSARRWCVVGLAFAITLAGCGGGSSGGGQTTNPPGTPTTPDFALSVSPAAVSIQDGQSEQVSLSATGSNGFSSMVAVQVNGLTTGVTISPASLSLTPGTPLQATISASTTAPTATATVTFTGTSGTLTHTAQLAVSNTFEVTSNAPSFRTRYVRTDAATLYFGWPNSNWIVYNPPTSRFFLTDPDSNRVFVLDATSQTVMGSIPLPGAYGLDDTPDHKTLYVGTQIGDVYTVDPVNMVVTARYKAANIGPDGFHAYSALAMANGKVALLGGQGGFPAIDGYSEFALWNPTDNTISTYPGCSQQVMSVLGFTRSSDRTKVFLGASGGGVCELDASTGAITTGFAAGASSAQHLAISPDGTRIVVPTYPGGLVVLDAHTLAPVNQFAIAGDTSSAAELFIGADSNTLYVSSSSTIYVYNLSSGQQIGWFPNIVVTGSFIGGVSAAGPSYGPQFQAMDGTGLLVGPMEQGVGFLDTTAMRTGTVGTQFMNAYLNPATGPAVGNTSTSWSDYQGETAVASTSRPSEVIAKSGNTGAHELFTSASLASVYFGNQPASSVTASPSSSNSLETTISATTPAGAPGLADVYALTVDGGMQLLPQAFSFGPTILKVIPNAATAEGGPGAILGYGFGPTSGTTFPSGLQVTVGGTPATITEFVGNAYGVSSPPFPLEAVTYVIPPGAAGSSADVALSASSGSTTFHNGVTYLPAIQQYPLAGSSLAQGIYDSHRDVYYFTDATKIQVFSRKTGAWLAPISIPAPYAPKRLWGIALSPNGSLLAVADASAEAIYVLNLDSPSSINRFLVPQSIDTVTNPVGIAISDAGMVYYTASTPGISGSDCYFKLDTQSGQVTDYHLDMPGVPDSYLRTLISADNSTVYNNAQGQVFLIDTATDKVTEATDDQGCCYGDDELALSANQATLAATGYFYDSRLNGVSSAGLSRSESLNISYLYGEKLSPDGTLLFQPTTVGIDVLDARLGLLLERIALPVALSSKYDALASDGSDNVLVAITGANSNGVAVIDLSSIASPAPLAYETGGGDDKVSVAAEHTTPLQREQTTGAAAAGSPLIPARHVIPHVTKPLF
jgi:hypothetical protein